MFDIHYKGFVITYYTSWIAKEILSILYVKLCVWVTLSLLFISQAYPTDKQPFCQVSPFLRPWSGYWVIKIDFSVKQFHVHGRYKTW